MLAFALTSLIAMPPSAPQPAPIRALAARLSRPGKEAVVKVAVDDARCVVHAVDVDDATVAAVKESGQETVLRTTARGLDLRRRACRSAAVVDVSFRSVVDVAYGKDVVVRIAAHGFEIDSSGVLVPCRKSDDGGARVCARLQNAVVSGTLTDGVLWVSP